MSKRNDVTTKIDADVLEDCRLAAQFKKMQLAEYLSECMRVTAKRDIDEGYAARQAEAKAAEKKQKGKG